MWSIFSKQTDSAVMSSTHDLRVVVVGPTGSGKSSTANTIMMRADGQTKKLYRTGYTSDPVTRWNEEYTRNVLGRQITVVDTPGADNAQDDPGEILKEIRAAIENSDKPYDAILYVVSVFGNTLQLDDLTLRIFKLADSILGEVFWKHCVLVFTYGDNFGRMQRDLNGIEYENVGFEQFIRKDKTSRNTHAIGPYVQLVSDAAVMIENNTEGGNSVKNEMVEQILQKIEYVKMKNHGEGFNKYKMKENPVYPKVPMVPKYKVVYATMASYLKQYGMYMLVALLILVIARLWKFK